MSGMATAIVGSTVIGAVSSSNAASKAAGAAKDSSRASIAEQQRQFDLIRGDTAPYRAAGTAALGQLQRLYGLGGGSAAPTPTQLQVGGRVGIPVGESGNYGAAMGRTLGGQMGGGGLARIQPGAGRATAAAAPAGPDLSAFWQSPDYQFNLEQGQRGLDNALVSRGGALSGAGAKAGIRYASGMASQQFNSFADRLASIAGIGQVGNAQSASAGMNAANNISSSYLNEGQARGSAYLQGAAGLNNAAQGGISNLLLSRYLGGGGGGLGGGWDIGG